MCHSFMCQFGALLAVGPVLDWEAPRLQGRLVRAFQSPVPEDDFAALFAARWDPVAKRLPFPTDVGDIGRGLTGILRAAANLHMLLFTPILKLSCNAWRLCTAISRCLFCSREGSPDVAHVLACDGLFSLLSALLPDAAWLSLPPRTTSCSARFFWTRSGPL